MPYKVVTLTQGNINNNHFYLAQVMDLFPPSSIGGGSKATEGSELLEVHSGINQPVLTDIAGDKKIFRRRAWVGEFFKAHKLGAGDFVVIEKTGPYRYHVYPQRG